MHYTGDIIMRDKDILETFLALMIFINLLIFVTALISAIWLSPLSGAVKTVITSFVMLILNTILYKAVSG